MKKLVAVLLFVLVTSISWSQNLQIVLSDNIQSSDQKYSLACYADKTISTESKTSLEIAEMIAPDMPEKDVSLLADQIAYINYGKKGDNNLWNQGTKLTVPIYKKGSRLHQADMRNWHYAICAGLNWGVHPALLLAIRNHENPSSSRDGFALGVMIVKWQGIWLQYDWGSKIIARLARARNMNPLQPTREGLRRCNRQPGGYAASQAWSGAVWSNYRNALGK